MQLNGVVAAISPTAALTALQSKSPQRSECHRLYPLPHPPFTATISPTTASPTTLNSQLTTIIPSSGPTRPGGLSTGGDGNGGLSQSAQIVIGTLIPGLGLIIALVIWLEMRRRKTNKD